MPPNTYSPEEAASTKPAARKTIKTATIQEASNGFIIKILKGDSYETEILVTADLVGVQTHLTKYFTQE